MCVCVYVWILSSKSTIRFLWRVLWSQNAHIFKKGVSVRRRQNLSEAGVFGGPCKADDRMYTSMKARTRCLASVVRISGAIHGATTFSDKYLGLEHVHSAWWVNLSSYLEEKSSGASLEKRDYGQGIRSTGHGTPLYPLKMALTSPASDCRSVGIVRSQTKARSYCY
jgi:hypothetical protein